MSHPPFHAKLRRDRALIDAIRFNVEDRFKAALAPTLRAAYRLGINDYNGVQSPQLLIEHLEDI